MAARSTLLCYSWCLVIVLLTIPFVVQSQITLSGSVRDSVSAAPLPFVIIQSSEKVPAITGDDGLFQFTCNAGDTIAFTRLGFKTVILIKVRSEKELTIKLSESTTILKSITVFGDYKPYQKAKWREYIILPRLGQNPTMRDSLGMIQTFGVGVKIPGPISYFTNYEKNRSKYKRILQDQASTETYREVITSEKVKQDLIHLFSLPESAYYQKIEKFNLTYPEVAYVKDREEIIATLTRFFALK